MKRTFRYKRLTLVATVMAAALTLTACGGGTGGTAQPSETDTAAADPTAVLSYSYYKAPGTFDVQKANSGFDNAPLFLVFDRLVHNTPNGDAAPGLAESWEFSNDSKTLTMKLRKDVKFHDGTQFNAEAVKANIERGKTVEGSAVAPDLANVESVDVVDPYTVQFNLKKPAVSTVLLLSDRAGAMTSPAAFDTNLDVHPVGAGMYKVKTDYTPGVSISLERFDGYWDPKAQLLAGVEMTFNPDSTARLNAVRSGAANVANIDAGQIDEAEAAGLNVVSGYDLQWGSITFNPDVIKPLADERVRLAINYAIDRKAIVDGVFFGHAAEATQIFPEGYPGYNPDVEPYTFDLDRAKKLMADAGYADGFDLQFNHVPSTLRARIGEVLAGQLAKINIRVTLAVTEGQIQQKMYVTERSIMAQNNAWSGRPDPAMTIQINFLADGWQNPGHLTSEKVTRLYNEAEAERDPDKRWALIRQISAELVEHPLSVFPTFRAETANVASKNVIGMQVWMSGKLEFRGVGISK